MRAIVDGAEATVFYLIAADPEQAAIFRASEEPRPRGWRDGWLLDEPRPGVYVGIPVYRHHGAWIAPDDLPERALSFDFVQRKIARGRLVYLTDDGEAGEIRETDIIMER